MRGARERAWTALERFEVAAPEATDQRDGRESDDEAFTRENIELPRRLAMAARRLTSCAGKTATRVASTRL